MNQLNKKLDLLSEHFNEAVQLRKVDEYVSLFIGNRMITQGESEVEKRIDVLIRENGLTYYLYDNE